MDLSNIHQFAPDARHAAGLARKLFGNRSAAPIVSDQELDRLGRLFLAHGGHEALGPFEEFVRRSHQQAVDIDALRRAHLRSWLDQAMKVTP